MDTIDIMDKEKINEFVTEYRNEPIGVQVLVAAALIAKAIDGLADQLDDGLSVTITNDHIFTETA